MGSCHGRQYGKMPDVELGFYDRSPERAASFQSSFGGQEMGSTEALIAWADVVDVCLPTDLHADACLAAIAAGRAVFCEKPLARDLASAIGVVEAADKAGVPLMPGQVVRFFPEFATGNRLVKSGAVGDPAVARTRRGGSAPFGAGGWFMDAARSGGILLDLAIHDFDWLRWTLGEVKTVHARRVRVESGAEYALTVLSFESGCLGHVEATWMDPSGFRTTFEVAGSGGLIEFDSRTSPSLRISTGPTKSTENPLGELDDPYYKEIRAFLDSVKDGTPPPVTGLDGVKALAISLAAIQSVEEDRTVTPASAF
jgi:predicted dehydrogenase